MRPSLSSTDRLCPGLRSSFRRTSFGITIWYLGDKVDIVINLYFRCPFLFLQPDCVTDRTPWDRPGYSGVRDRCPGGRRFRDGPGRQMRHRTAIRPDVASYTIRRRRPERLQRPAAWANESNPHWQREYPPRSGSNRTHCCRLRSNTGGHPDRPGWTKTVQPPAFLPPSSDCREWITAFD